jgi:hypothetical protein
VVGITACEHYSQLIDRGLEELSSVPEGFSLSIRDKRGGGEIRRHRRMSLVIIDYHFIQHAVLTLHLLVYVLTQLWKDCIVHVNN